MRNPDPTVGQVLLDYSVRAETAAGCLRNALQILDVARSLAPVRPASELALDLGAVSRLVREALVLIEGAPK